MTVFPVTQVPEIVGVGFVLVTGIGLTVTGATTTGVVTVLIVNAQGAVAGETLPAMSLCVAVIE